VIATRGATRENLRRTGGLGGTAGAPSRPARLKLLVDRTWLAGLALTEGSATDSACARAALQGTCFGEGWRPERPQGSGKLDTQVYVTVLFGRVLRVCASNGQGEAAGVPELDSVAVERFVAERTTTGAPADQISRARISGGGVSHAFDRPAS
jgi:hypothetical protein